MDLGQAGWAMMFWPIFVPAIIVILIVVTWWFLAGAKVKKDLQSENKKDYSLIFIGITILLVVIIGWVVYSLNKIPQ